MPGWGRLAAGLVLAGQGMMFGLGLNLADPPPAYGSGPYIALHGLLALSAVAVMVLLGGPLFRGLWAAMRRGRPTLEALFVMSAGGAWAASVAASITGEGAIYYEVVAIVMVIFTIGRGVAERTRAKVAEAAAAWRERFDIAHVECADGRREPWPVAAVVPGRDRVVVAPGEPIPVDGVIAAGEGFVQEQALTGEPAPVRRAEGDRVRAGTWSVDGRLLLEVTAAAGERELDGILATVAIATHQPPVRQRQAERILAWFVPGVALAAILTFIGWWTLGGDSAAAALIKAMAVLLVACPCAFGLATPMAVWAALLGLGRLGVVARHGALLDALARADLFVFDKTGTLSEGSLAVSEFRIEPAWRERANWLRAAVAAAEAELPHPVARALVKAGEGAGESVRVAGLAVVPGRGLKAIVSDSGGATHELDIGPAADAPKSGSPRLDVAVDGVRAAVIDLEETLRDGADAAIDGLQRIGIRSVVLTGDPNPAWREISGAPVESGMSAADKADRVRGWNTSGSRIVVVGDGVNDTGAMAVAPAALAIAEGPALARATADGVLLGRDLGRLPEAVELCRALDRRLRQNLSIAVSYNGVGITVAAAGLLHPALAALIMAASSVTVAARVLAVVREPASGSGGLLAAGGS